MITPTFIFVRTIAGFPVWIVVYPVFDFLHQQGAPATDLGGIATDVTP